MYQSPVNKYFLRLSGAKPYLATLALFFMLPTIVFAKDFSRLYSQETLEHVQSVYGKNIEGMLYGDISSYLLPNEQKSLSEVKLSIPLYGNKSSVFDFSMNLKTGKMTISALSIKFFDDIGMALAWYEDKKLDSTKVMEYVLKLHTQDAYFQAPLKALDVPDKAWELSRFVDDVSQKSLKSGLTYLLLHELGHWHYQHIGPYDAISQRQAQKQEKQSDAMALEIMGRMHTAPYGMVTWFLMTGLLQASEATTHPLSTDRLTAIANKIEIDPSIFIARENVGVISEQDILAVSADIRNIATVMRSVRK